MESAEIPILETERLWLRPLRRRDFPDYAAMYSDRDVVRYLGGGPEPWERGRAWRHMAYLVGHWQLHGFGSWAVEERATATFVGMAGFAAPEGWPGFELGWALARPYWGLGYATESARAALAHAFDVWSKDRVISLIHPENHASIRVAERLGETFESRILHFGREMLCYGIDRLTWAGFRSSPTPSGRQSSTPSMRKAPSSPPTRSSIRAPEVSSSWER